MQHEQLNDPTSPALLMHRARRRRATSLPTTPAGVVAVVMVAIIAVVLMTAISSQDDGFPDVPSGQVVDGPEGDEFELPAVP